MKSHSTPCTWRGAAEAGRVVAHAPEECGQPLVASRRARRNVHSMLTWLVCALRPAPPTPTPTPPPAGALYCDGQRPALRPAPAPPVRPQGVHPRPHGGGARAARQPPRHAQGPGPGHAGGCPCCSSYSSSFFLFHQGFTRGSCDRSCWSMGAALYVVAAGRAAARGARTWAGRVLQEAPACVRPCALAMCMCPGMHAARCAWRVLAHSGWGGGSGEVPTQWDTNGHRPFRRPPGWHPLHMTPACVRPATLRIMALLRVLH